MGLKDKVSKEVKPVKTGVTPNMINKKSPTQGRPRLRDEAKKKITLAIYPSVYESVQKIAFKKGTSVSHIVGELLEAYIEKNK